MISHLKNNLTVLQFDNLSRFPVISHFSTTRIGGCSTDSYDSFNLGFNSGDIPKNVIANRNKLCDTLEIDPAQLVFPKQTHTGTVKVISSKFFDLDENRKKQFLIETDALITNLKNVCIAIKTADCVPLLVYDPVKQVIAAIHAGWRGTAQNIVQNTIHQMIASFGSNPSDLWAGIGPSISPEIYEVGQEVWSQFAPKFYQHTNPFKRDKRLLNLWKANFHQLTAFGVPEKQIEVAQICTLSNPDLFFSARRDGAKTGRMATGIWLTVGD
ncbi:MAG: peptidoglycan editing factor PgeF [Mariniphaga sp.]